MRRDTPPRRETGQATAGGTAGRAGERSHWDGDFPHPTLNQSAKGSGGVGASNQELFSQRGAYLAPIWRGSDQANAETLIDQAGTLNCNKGQQGGILFDVAHTLKGEGFDASEDGTGRGTPLVPVQAFYSNESRCNNIPPPGISPPLKVGSGGTSGNPPAVVSGVATNMAVRRLTPVECERLQGFPDGYTNIPWRGKPEAPDGPRYKALGNSMAVPVMRWIGRRIKERLT